FKLAGWKVLDGLMWVEFRKDPREAVISVAAEAILADYPSLLKLSVVILQYRTLPLMPMNVKVELEGVRLVFAKASEYLAVIHLVYVRGMKVQPPATQTSEAVEPISPMSQDPLGVLMQGMTQLQTAMSQTLSLKSKDIEVVKPGLTELPRLQDLSKNSAIDFGDWLHGLQNHMGDLSNSSSQWWNEVLACLSRFYSAYLDASHVGKLVLKAEDYETSVLREERWTRVDKRASAMILASLPENVRAELLSSRVVGTLATLCRVVILYRPGSVAERQQILRALESPNTAATAADAVQELRRWARWVARATDIGIQCPDPSVMIKGLDLIVKKILGDHADISFRVSMLRYTLEVDTRPTLQGAKSLQQALLSELEQVAYSGRQGGTAAPAVKAIATGKGQDALQVLSFGQRVQPWSFVYLLPRFHEKGGDGRSYYVFGLHRTGVYDLFLAEIKSLLQEASAMLKEIRQLKTMSLTITQVQNRAVGVGCSPSTGRTGLLESGASHPFREATEDELQDATQVTVQLAGGREAVLAQGKSGTLLTRKTKDDCSSPIVPLGALVQELGCQVTWSRRGGLVIRHPDHGVIRPKMIGRCPVVAESQALELIHEIECRKLQSLENATRATAKALWMWDVKKKWAQHLSDFVGTGGRVSQLAAMSSEGSPFIQWTDLEKSLIAENVELTDKAGWSLDPAFLELDDGKVLVQVDINRSKAEDMNMVSGVYRALLWAAATGRVSGIFGSPPTKPELLQKMMWLAVVSKAARAVYGGQPVFVMVEGQSVLKLAKCGGLDRWTSVFSTREAFLEAACLEEVEDNLVTNMKMREPLPKATDGSLAWTYDFKRAVVEAIQKWEREQEALQVVKWMKKLDVDREKFLEGFTDKELEMWRTHVRLQLPEERIGAYCLSLDVAGPFWVKAKDPNHKDYRYLLVGAYVLPRQPSEPRPESHEPPGEPSELYDQSRMSHRVNLLNYDQSRMSRLENLLNYDQSCTMYQSSVMKTRMMMVQVLGLSHSTTVTQLMMEEFERIYNEVGVELVYIGLESSVWSRCDDGFWKRGSLVTYTEGQAPQANGRAEAAVKWTKAAVKRLLASSGLGKENWAMAAGYAAQCQLERVLKQSTSTLPFGTKVHVRSKVYGTGGRYDLDSRWKAGCYVGPSLDVRGGHVVLLENGAYMTSTHLRPYLVEPDKVVELDEYELLLPMPTRRLRTKAGARDLDPATVPGELSLKYDPEHPAEQYAMRLLSEEVLTPDQCEILALMLPSTTAVPSRFGPQNASQKVWSVGAFVHGGVAGVKTATAAFPASTRVFVKYVKQLQPDHQFNAIAVTTDVGAQQHVDAHNVGMNLIAGLSYFKGGALEVEEPEGKRLLPLDGDHTHQLFDPRLKHSTKSWYGGSRVVLIAYSVRDSGKLLQNKADYLKDFGFTWTPHLSRPRGEEEGARLSVLRVGLLEVAQERDVPEQPRDSPEQEGTGGGVLDDQEPDIRADPDRELSHDGVDAPGSLSYLTEDIELVIGDLEDIRDLLEEEEIMCEEYRRTSQATRGVLTDARDQICAFLEGVHEELVELERKRSTTCLKAAKISTTSASSDQIDYEVKRNLSRWVDAIRKEVNALIESGTLRRISLAEAKQLEKDSRVTFAPAKCVFTLKPPLEAGKRARRKCRVVMCGNHVRDNLEFGDLYASGTSSDALRVSLVIAALRCWLGAVSDITGAFLLANWPPDLPKYGIYPPRVVKDSGVTEAEAWIVERPLYGLRESPRIWSLYRNERLRRARIRVGEMIVILRPTVAEPELWMILCEVTGTMHGLIVLYVDDIAYFSTKEIIVAIHDFITQEWPASPLEWISGDDPVRYLGVEIRKEPRTTEDGRASWVYTIGQGAYVQDLLREHNMMEVQPTSLPAPKEWIDEAESCDDVEGDYEETTLKLAQKHVGECLWLATKTRPDIMFVTTHAASLVSKRPSYVIRLSKRVLAYLAGTVDLRMTMGPVKEEDAMELVVTRRMADGRLGCTLLKSVQALVTELFPTALTCVLAVDNTSAAAMLAGGDEAQDPCSFDGENPSLSKTEAQGEEAGAGVPVRVSRCKERDCNYNNGSGSYEIGEEEDYNPDEKPLLHSHSSYDSTYNKGFHPSENDERYEYPEHSSRSRPTARFAGADTLQLMTCEDLRSALRLEGMPVSGVKSDLAERLVHKLAASDVTSKQFRYVLYLWRLKSLNFKCKLQWEDINSKCRISMWISTWKGA
ncbi:RE1, partial [Symbiodinium necroappetens]